MFSEKQIVSKGYYAHSQIEGFLSIQQFIFVQDHQQHKHLLLRLRNAGDFIANSLEFTLTQLDSTGKVLGQSSHRFDGLTFRPGRVLTLPQSIPVHNFCTDFKLEFSLVTSGNFIYRVENQQVAVHYTPTLSSDPFLLEPVRSVFSLSVNPLRQGKPALAVLCGTLALLLLFGLSAYRMYDRYQDALEEAEEKTAYHQLQPSTSYYDSE